MSVCEMIMKKRGECIHNNQLKLNNHKLTNVVCGTCSE